MTPDEALQILEKCAVPLPAETVALEDAFDRILARAFSTPFDMPPFSRSAMDGYAVRAADVAGASVDNPVTLRVEGKVLAGGAADEPLRPGTARRIATGGALPPGADTVLRQEDVVVIGPADDEDRPDQKSGSGGQHGRDPRIVITKPAVPGKDVVAAGAKGRRGQVLLPRGHRLKANDIGLLAAFGAAKAEVVRRPRVAYVETGDELVTPGSPLPPGHIYGSNNAMLAPRAQEHGATVVARRRIGDDPQATEEACDELLRAADVVVSTGGVSVGPKDLIPDALRAVGCDILFHGLPVRPGHPILAARRGDRLWIGLAGNPTAAFVTHEFFVRPVLWRLGGLRFAQGFNPEVNVAVDGPPVAPRPRTSLYLGRLRSKGGVESVLVDRSRRPTALPGPFHFDSIVRIDPPTDPAAAGSATDLPVPPRPVRVYPADRALAEARLTPFPVDVGGILLAGGRSRRMGHSKLPLPVDGVPLIVRAYRALAETCSRVRVIGAPDEAVELLTRWQGDGVRDACFPDDRPGEGPLAGLITGLRRTPEPMALCLAADLPFVDARALDLLLQSARLGAVGTGLPAAARGSAPKSDPASTPVSTPASTPASTPTPVDIGFVLAEGDRQQPLAGLYPTAPALAASEAVWAEGGRAVKQFVARLGVEPVEVAVPGTLANVNTPEEYRAARETTAERAETRAETGARPAVLSFAGHSGSGKTTFIRRLIPLLKERGLRVVVIKHGKRFELDRPGKDSWHYRQAGADGVLLAGPDEFAYMATPAAPRSFAELLRQAKQEADVVLVEGFKSEPTPKVAVLRPDESWTDHPLRHDPSVQAVYGGRPGAGAAEAATSTDPATSVAHGPAAPAAHGPAAPAALGPAAPAAHGSAAPAAHGSAAPAAHGPATGTGAPGSIPFFPRRPDGVEDEALSWALQWIVARLGS